MSDFSLKIATQMEELSYDIQEKMYDKAAKYSKYKIMRLSGIFLGVTSFVVNTTFRIAALAEHIFKGLINILGTNHLEDSNILVGIQQIFIGIPKEVFGLIFSPITNAIYTLYVTGHTLWYPEACLNTENQRYNTLIGNLDSDE